MKRNSFTRISRIDTNTRETISFHTIYPLNSAILFKILPIKKYSNILNKFSLEILRRISTILSLVFVSCHI